MRFTIKKTTLTLLVFISIFILFSCSEQEPRKINVFMIGDSTMAEKKDPENNPERGWGMVFPELFNENVSFYNHAKNGRSTKSFIDEGRWDTVVNHLNPGDYVIIQFGHNDRKAYDPERYTNPYSSYRRNLEKFVKDTENKGANPIICSSIVRRNFNEDKTLEDTHGPYPFVARYVASDCQIPFLDLQQKTEDWISELGDTASQQYFMILKPDEFAMYPEGRTDNTHLRTKGAYQVSLFAAEELVNQNVPLSDYLKPEIMDQLK